MTDWSTVAWHRSTRCESNSCVEVGLLDSRIAARDSKDANGPAVLLRLTEWEGFLHRVRNQGI